ncbi:hypothetical protein BDR05DRAFT_1004601 [Suillus weaverae]|nr:hypothetical protein BDR05DRAFT_1004601 [Suillus weaverae]
MSYHATHPQNTATKLCEWVKGTDVQPKFVESTRNANHVTAAVSVFCEPVPSSAMICRFTCDSPEDGIILPLSNSSVSESCHYNALSVALAAGQHLLTRKDKEDLSLNLAPAVTCGKRICREKTGTDWQTVLDIIQYGKEKQNRQNEAATKEMLLRSSSTVRGLCNATSPADSQHPVDSEEQQHDNTDVEMSNPGNELDFHLEEIAPPIRRVPRSFDEIKHLSDDINYSDNTDIPPTQHPASLPAQSQIKRVLLTLRDTLHTAYNSFGLCRLYPWCPSFEPDEIIASTLLARMSPTVHGAEPLPNISAPPHPFPNMTIYWLMSWMNSGGNMLSETKVSHLVKDVMLAEDFDPKHLEKFSVRRSLQELDQDTSGKKIIFPDDWIQTSVTISIPTKSRQDGPQPYTIPGLHYRPLIDKDPLDSHQEQVYNELYTSDALLEAQDNIQKLPKEPGCLLERIIVGLMFFSNATHLANFGTAKAWPLYLYFGNLTKYARASPNSGACHLVGFLPSLPDSIKDILGGLFRISKSGMASLHAHCCRELFHACWEILLDADFIEAYRHGIIMKCADGMYLLLPTLSGMLIHSSKHRALISTIKDMGLCPCPRCITPKSMFSFLGLARDMKSRLTNFRVYTKEKVLKAYNFIYRWGNTVDSTKVENALREGSWVPTLNQFVNKLGPLSLDSFCMLVIDFMHECKLGTWKALFTHLIRLLYALPQGSQLVAKLDRRFREVPMFGNSTIRKFSDNTSEMKHLAAHDFKDILQCTIPIFEGLFPAKHDAAVQSLLYQFTQWHTQPSPFSKKRSANYLECYGGFETAPALPSILWSCPGRKRLANEGLLNSMKLEIPLRNLVDRGLRSSTWAPMYKFHAMGDYVRTIKLFRTMDSFTTQMGELAHRALKMFYPLTNKLDTPAQLAKHERRHRALRQVAEAGAIPSSSYSQPQVEVPPSMPSGKHHWISAIQNSPVDIFSFLHENNGDPAVKNFIPKLQDHILFRLWGLDVTYCNHTFTDEERNLVIIPNNRIYSVQTMQVHYTTYNLQRKYDTINPRSHGDVMVLSGETAPSHPYCVVVLNLGARFADQDMFMQYTHLGVGHAATLWRIHKDCLGSALAAHTDAMDVENYSSQDGVGCEEVGDGEASDQGDDDEGEISEDCEEFDNDSDEELREGSGD